jgi:DNA repair protein RecN (Recombination protein N)
MNSSLVRDETKPCAVEAVFSLAGSSELAEDPCLSELLDGGETDLIIRRSSLPDGRNKIVINGLASTVTQLKDIGRRLMDFHGPHDHQMLFSEDSHLDILDRLSSLKDEKTLYAVAFENYSSLKRDLAGLKELVSSREREMETLASRIKELEQVPLDNSSYENILEESSRAANSEKLYDRAREIVDLLGTEDTGVSSLTQRAFAKMRGLTDIDASKKYLSESLDLVQSECDKVLSDLADYLESLSFSPEQAAEINRKCDIYYDILRKYGPGIDDAREFYSELKKQYTLLADIDNNTAEIVSRISSVEKDLKKLAAKITSKRIKTAKDLKDVIEKELKDLGILHVEFECKVEKTELSSSGENKVSFYISPNAGEDLKPLADIVSSGEAARVMLALKKALTQVDPIPCLVFDEIDAQIGGRLGTITGKKLKELSSERQVILITHLPQIASFADRHIKVSKSVSSGRTSVTVGILEGQARTNELAKMMSGEKENRIALTHAKNMLESAKK